MPEMALAPMMRPAPRNALVSNPWASSFMQGMTGAGLVATGHSTLSKATMRMLWFTALRWMFGLSETGTPTTELPQLPASEKIVDVASLSPHPYG